MKREDLRIRNLVEYENTYHTINQIRIERIFTRHHAQSKCECDYVHSIEEIKPIPLTEEWLVKFGFIKISEDNFIRRGVKILIEDGICFLCFNNDFIEIEFIHVLQNVFYPLTGEELIYTP